MRYAGLMKNDLADGKGVCVSFWVQGCPLHCKGCHNSQTWDFNGGEELPHDILDQINAAITAQGVERNFSVLGGEPLCEENIALTYQIVRHVRERFPGVTIYCWSGYYLKDLLERDNPLVKATLDLVNVLIDGPFELDKRDVTLELRGSTNQGIKYKGRDF